MDKILHTKAEVVAKEEEGVVEGVVGSTEVIDRLEEVIEQDGWELSNYKKNPVVLWGHNVREERPPIGKAVKVWLEGVRKKKLTFNIKFDLEDTFAAEIYRKVKEGFLSTVSVGFLPIDYEPMNKDDTSFFAPQRYTKQELLELSFVPVPANPEALTTLKSMGIEPVELKDLYPKPSDNIIEYIDKGIAPISEGWDGPGEIAKAELGDLDEEINTLALEREDKYQVRLIKKLISLNKKRPVSQAEKEIIAALKLIDDALSTLKGGEKH